MTNPTVFGINGNSLMVGGEAGDEAILPLAEFYNKLNSILDKKLDAVQKSQVVYVTNHTYIDGDEIASRTVSKVDAEMVTNKRKGRQNRAMKINGIDIRKYDAKQLTADVQPPSFANSYEWLTGAALPTEFETEVQMGHLKLSIYFKGKDRNNIIRAASEFMSNFTKACKMELDGYKGTYIGFITSNDYEKKNVKQRYVVNLEFDGFFVDDDLSITFDGKTSASFYKVGTRDAPCVVEVYAKSALTNYTITGLGEDDIIIESLAAGKTVVIDAKTGLATIDGANAFDKVNMWTFPVLKTGETALTFSNTKARVTIRYTPMWI